MPDDLFWALSPEYAQNFFAKRSDPVKPHCEVAGEPTLASQISRREGKTTVIKIEGPLEKTTWVGFYSGRILSLGYDVIQQAIADAAADASVTSILLSFDSPGGTVSGAKELADYIGDISKIKPIAAYADGLCASAAYWLASATGTVYSPATALVGSVGVIMRCENWSAFYNKAGIQIDYLVSGKFKAAGQDAKELTDEERKYFEDQLAAIHAIFKADVQAGLALACDEALWAEAQLLPASRAIDLGLVSRIVRDETEAISLLKGSIQQEKIMDLTQLKAEHPKLVEEIRAEAGKQAEQEKFKALNEQSTETLALVRLIAGEDIASRVETVQKSGITAAQLKMLEPLIAGFKAQWQTQKSGEEKAREQILAGIANATGAPVTQNTPEPAAKSRLVADAERRSSYIPGGYDK